ncbi:tol-pal system protein YbgF [Fulvivirga sp. 29W222]|uniref:Tol-pal system protein YbgF n=1 Tax=Fulvivirga marina TaxID=2494733 RepID=A0A937FYT4_9BACT|nr:tetratricopeptide repeat protein [Fulvivirga marina]MBL6446865.1 tol-pal system protein YbgF [Fulvivirga marina]
MKRILIILMCSLGLTVAFAQSNDAANDNKPIILISDMQLQIDVNQAMNDLYNFKFDKAEKQFRWLKQKYGWHPLPYFLLGLSEWWKIMPNVSNTEYDERFLAYMDTVIHISERLHEMPKHEVEASFFLAAAYGFKGRLYSSEERKNWTKSAFAGKNALKYMKESQGMHDLSPELLFGDALYNYFSVWVPENYPLLKPILAFFPKGDKELGIKQLREVSYNAFYTRTEAMVFLMRIMGSYENNKRKALQIGGYLHQTYPDNPYFHRYYARLLYTSGKFSTTKPVAESILARIDSGMIGYEATSGRYAAFFLGQIHESRKEYQEAKEYYLKAKGFSEQIDATDTGYYLYSLLSLGEIYQQEGNEKEAKKYLKLVKKHAKRSDDVHEKARERLREF